MHTFTLQIITSGRKEIAVKKDRESRTVRVKGFAPGLSYSAEDAKDLASLFASVAKLLTGAV